MLRGFHFGPNLFDSAIRSDQEGDAPGSHVLHAHEALLAPDTVSLDDLFVLVGQEGERKLLFGNELVVRFCGIGADAEDDSAFLFESRKLVPEGARLLGATRSVITG